MGRICNLLTQELEDIVNTELSKLKKKGRFRKTHHCKSSNQHKKHIYCCQNTFNETYYNQPMDEKIIKE